MLPYAHPRLRDGQGDQQGVSANRQDRKGQRPREEVYGSPPINTIREGNHHSHQRCRRAGSCYSDSPAMIRQLTALVERVGGKEEPAQTTTGYRCLLPKAAINALIARRQYRPLTQEERQARVARLQGKVSSTAGHIETRNAGPVTQCIGKGGDAMGQDRGAGTCRVVDSP